MWNRCGEIGSFRPNKQQQLSSEVIEVLVLTLINCFTAGLSSRPLRKTRSVSLAAPSKSSKFSLTWWNAAASREGERKREKKIMQQSATERALKVKTIKSEHKVGRHSKSIKWTKLFPAFGPSGEFDRREKVNQAMSFGRLRLPRSSSKDADDLFAHEWTRLFRCLREAYESWREIFSLWSSFAISICCVSVSGAQMVWHDGIMRRCMLQWTFSWVRWLEAWLDIEDLEL